MLLVHIAGGIVAVLAGYAALAARKGSRPHRYAGYAFVAGMLVMAAGAMVVGWRKGQYGNVLAAVFVVYLVGTAVTTLLRPSAVIARLNTGLRILALPVGLLFAASGAALLAGPATTTGGVPARSIAVASFLNAAVMLLGWWGDVRVSRRGAPRGAARVRRHLWRMCYAMFVASGSFFLGQPQAVPEPLRVGPVLVGLALFPLLALPFFLWRWRERRPPAAPGPAEALPAVVAGP